MKHLLIAILVFEGLQPGSKVGFFSKDGKPITVFWEKSNGQCELSIPIANPAIPDYKGRLTVCVAEKDYIVKIWR